jgi:glycosyltransferase involved in cell wall biosynthesis
MDIKNKQPLVTILITNYNHGNYLAEAIESALKQTYSYIEIIVIDDGSTDNSLSVIERFKGKIITITKENGGQASAINTGFDNCHGDIICLLDADDIWLPHKVENIVKAFTDKDELVSIVYHQVQNINQTGEPQDKLLPRYKPVKGKITRQVVKAGGWFPFPPSTALSFSRDFLSWVMNIPEMQFKTYADAYLGGLAPFFGEVVGIDEVLSYYRYPVDKNHNYSALSKNAKETQKILQEYELREQVLNATMRNLGLKTKFSLTDNLPYQLLRYKLGLPINLISLSLLVLQNPWELRFFSKVKFAFALWAKNLTALDEYGQKIP